MINSRRTITEDDQKQCCAKCKHLKIKPGKNQEGLMHCCIDGLIYLDPGLISMFTCDKFKEVK